MRCSGEGPCLRAPAQGSRSPLEVRTTPGGGVEHLWPPGDGAVTPVTPVTPVIGLSFSYSSPVNPPTSITPKSVGSRENKRVAKRLFPFTGKGERGHLWANTGAPQTRLSGPSCTEDPTGDQNQPKMAAHWGGRPEQCCVCRGGGASACPGSFL